MTIDNSKLGWLVAAALAGVVAVGSLSGFQGNTAPKFATVDIERVFDQSKLRETNSLALTDAQKIRSNAFSFIAQNPAMDNNDAKKYSELAVKDVPTPADTAELTRIKTAAEESTRKNRELQTKTNPTDDDKKTLANYGAQSQGKQAFLARLEADYQQQLQDKQRDLRDKTLDRVNEVVRGIAAKKGYTVVFTNASAVYAADDLTVEAQKALK